MAYDMNLADRIRSVFRNKGVRYSEKEMFGGVAFMVNEKMCAGIVKNDLMVRIDPDLYDALKKRRGARPMDFSGRPMKGYLYISPSGIDTFMELQFWIERCMDFNPKAKLKRKKSSS